MVRRRGLWQVAVPRRLQVLVLRLEPLLLGVLNLVLLLVRLELLVLGVLVGWLLLLLGSSFCCKSVEGLSRLWQAEMLVVVLIRLILDWRFDVKIGTIDVRYGEISLFLHPLEYLGSWNFCEAFDDVKSMMMFSTRYSRIQCYREVQGSSVLLFVLK